MVNTRRIEVKVTKLQHERIKHNAELKGKTVSQYVRSLTLEHDINIIHKILEIHTIVKKIQTKLK